MPTVLAPDSWATIREDYMRGRSARKLALQWGVSTSAIYRRAVQEGWAKQVRVREAPRDEADTFAPAHRREAPGDEGLPDLIGEVLTGEIHEPGFLARIAIGASGDALRNYEYDDAHKLIRIAHEYARVANRTGPNLHTVLRALTDPEYADALFEVEEGEMNLVKDIYWTNRAKAEANARRLAEKKAAEARAAEAEPEEAPPTPANAC